MLNFEDASCNQSEFNIVESELKISSLLSSGTVE